jgi:hypothetical protein
MLLSPNFLLCSDKKLLTQPIPLKRSRLALSDGVLYFLLNDLFCRGFFFFRKTYSIQYPGHFGHQYSGLYLKRRLHTTFNSYVSRYRM